jgi:hypothetical protein
MTRIGPSLCSAVSSDGRLPKTDFQPIISQIKSKGSSIKRNTLRYCHLALSLTSRVIIGGGGRLSSRGGPRPVIYTTDNPTLVSNAKCLTETVQLCTNV